MPATLEFFLYDISFSAIRFGGWEHMQESTQAFYINNLLEVLAEHGVNGVPLLRRCGIQPGALKYDDRLVPIEKFFALIEEAETACDLALLGLRVGLHNQLKIRDLLGYAMLSAPTLGEALARYCRYGAHLASMLHSRLAIKGNETEITFRVLRHYHASPVVERYLVWEITAILARFSERLGLKKPWISRIETVGHARGDEQDALNLLGIPVLWGCDQYKLVTSSDCLILPLDTASLLNASAVKKHYDAILEEIHAGLPVTAEINRIIILRPSNIPNIDEMGQLLGMSGRSLQRRLREEGTTYRQVILCFRMMFARYYLENSPMQAAEIGYLVGYTEPVNFYRAFKDYYGCSTVEARAGG